MKKNKYPHYKVMTRLRASPVHGVGVFAIKNIKKGTYIFYGDDDDLIWVEKDSIKKLTKEIRKYYEDFCIIKDGKYGCPKNFNLMTIAWYLNNSATPNVGCDENYNFYALRNIKAGEELTVDYNTYSE